ncbi:integrator complex subunit 6 [Hyalella azteca]|uniref:Integrator complex subunit 6 n=1 Tax=Hyalella azteca TaxID=294128 RepID=A0A8B7N7D9_HYAAZ|nr:integrator complex subunit 6 [Hyalella azteca]
MTIIVFLIDTSGSMNQKTFIGARPTLLDVAKGAVESFVKLRQRCPDSRGDRYMLFTAEDPPNHIKAGWKENLATFMNELKNIRATGLSTIGPAIRNVFDVLNINRMQSGIDTYGAGRSPFFLEPSLIVVITDGGRLTAPAGVQDEMFSGHKSSSIPGAELTREMYRWDQRLFALVLRLTGTPAQDPPPPPTPPNGGSASACSSIVPSDNSHLDRLCDATGGRSYCVRSHRVFQNCVESLVGKVQSGVVISFEKSGPDPPPVVHEGKDAPLPDIVEVDKENIYGSNSDNYASGSSQSNGHSSSTPLNASGCSNNHTVTTTSSGSTTTIPPPAWYNCRKMIYVPRPAQRGSPTGFWPIPESFWPDIHTATLPARSAHPNVKFTCTSQEPMVIDNLPFDKYELEPSPLTQFILHRRQPTVCWQVFVANSSSVKNSDAGHPFGYLKASTSLSCVNLFVMPYNYPVLLPLLEDLFKTHRQKPSKEWRQQFDTYLRTMPPYYANPLRRALARMGAHNLVPDNLDNCLSFQVSNHLKKLKNQGKVEYDRICAEVEKRVSSVSAGSSSSCNLGDHNGLVKVVMKRPLPRHLTSNHTLHGPLSHLREQVNEFNNFHIVLSTDSLTAPSLGGPGAPPSVTGGGGTAPQMYRNPFDISRHSLLDQLARMRANFLQPSVANLLLDRDQDQLHCRPIGQMGNYQDYLKKMPPALREIESTPVRQHMFGNPFKIDKKMSMVVDEADVDLPGGGASGGAGGSAGGGRGTKRGSSDPGPSMASGGPGLRPTVKRKRGPLPSDACYSRLLFTPPNSPQHFGGVDAAYPPPMVAATPPPSTQPPPPPPAPMDLPPSVVTPRLAPHPPGYDPLHHLHPTPPPTLHQPHGNANAAVPGTNNMAPSPTVFTPPVGGVMGGIAAPVGGPCSPPPSPASPHISPSNPQANEEDMHLNGGGDVEPAPAGDVGKGRGLSRPPLAAMHNQQVLLTSPDSSPLQPSSPPHSPTTPPPALPPLRAPLSPPSAPYPLAVTSQDPFSGQRNLISPAVSSQEIQRLNSGVQTSQEIQRLNSGVPESAGSQRPAAGAALQRQEPLTNQRQVVVSNQLLFQDTADAASHNRMLLLTLYKDVKRPGRNYGPLLSRLSTVQGSVESRIRLLKAVMHEASRFKRHSLIKLLDEYMMQQQRQHRGAINGTTNNPGASLRMNGHTR